MYAVTWGDGFLALVDDDGVIMEGGEPDLEQALSEPVRRDVGSVEGMLATDGLEVIEPGAEGFIQAALESLPESMVTHRAPGTSRLDLLTSHLGNLQKVFEDLE